MPLRCELEFWYHISRQFLKPPQVPSVLGVLLVITDSTLQHTLGVVIMPEVDLLSLQEIANKCPWEFLHCEACATLPRHAKSFDHHLKYTWCLRLQCRNLHTEWFICTLCSSLRKRFFSQQQLQKPHSKCHHSDDRIAKHPRLSLPINTNNDSNRSTGPEDDDLSLEERYLDLT